MFRARLVGLLPSVSAASRMHPASTTARKSGSHTQASARENLATVFDEASMPPLRASGVPTASCQIAREFVGATLRYWSERFVRFTKPPFAASLAQMHSRLYRFTPASSITNGGTHSLAPRRAFALPLAVGLVLVIVLVAGPAF